MKTIKLGEYNLLTVTKLVDFGLAMLKRYCFLQDMFLRAQR